MERNNKSLPAAKLPNRTAPAPKDESLINDVRAGLTPAQMVEQKLASLLNNSCLPISRLPAMRLRRPRP